VLIFIGGKEGFAMSLFAFFHVPRVSHRPDPSSTSLVALWAVLLGLLFLAIMSGAILIYGFHSGIVIG
jgi:hypothetical protein